MSESHSDIESSIGEGQSNFTSKIASGLPILLANFCLSYGRKLVTGCSGGVLDFLDPVLKRHSLDDLGEVV